MSRIIGVISGKGGVGKTTITANLATALSMKFGRKVTAVDCNLTTSHLGMHFGIFFYPRTFNDFLKGTTSIEDVLISHATGVNILPASLNLSDLVGIDMYEIREKLRDSLRDNDFVFLDSAPGFGKEAVSAMRACEEALLVTTPDVPAITDVLKAKSVLEQMNVEIIGLIVNKVTGKKFELSRQEIAETTGLNIIGFIPFSFEFSESLSSKTPLVAYKQHTKASIELLKIAAYLTGEAYKEPSMIERIISTFFRP